MYVEKKEKRNSQKLMDTATWGGIMKGKNHKYFFSTFKISFLIVRFRTQQLFFNVEPSNYFLMYEDIELHK